MQWPSVPWPSVRWLFVGGLLTGGLVSGWPLVGIVELRATILKIMRALFANYAHLFQFKLQSIKNGNRNTLSTRKQ